MSEIEHEIELVNNILEQAVRHGADDGGSYDNNEGNLFEAVYEWLKYRNLIDKYEVVHTGDNSNWCKLRIVAKNKCGDCFYCYKAYGNIWCAKYRTTTNPDTDACGAFRKPLRR